MERPLAIDLYCGLGGWTEGLLAEGFDVIGFDLERHVYGSHCYPAQLVIQDVRTLHGSQFKDAALIVASPPCQKYSYMAMPWKRSKAMAAAIRADTTGKMLAELNCLFDACFRIQAQASLAAGWHIPLIVENVKGAQKWVGRARWNFGSFYLWGDVPALMPPVGIRKVAADHLNLGGGNSFHRAQGSPAEKRQAVRYDSRHAERRHSEAFKSSGMNWSDPTRRGQDFTRIAGQQAIKNNGGSWCAIAHNTTSGKGRNPDGRKVPGGGADGWFGSNEHPLRKHHSKHAARKFASAMIAKIPLPLSRHIATVFRPPAN